MSTNRDLYRASRPLRRRLQFSLRSALLLVTFACLLLGMWIVPARRVDRAAELLQKAGAVVLYQP